MRNTSILGRLATAALLGNVLVNATGPTPRRRNHRMKGQGSNISYTRKGPGRRAPSRYVRDPVSGSYRLRGQRRYPFATGADSINAPSIARQMIRELDALSQAVTQRQVLIVSNYIDAMRMHGHETFLLEYAMKQRFAA